MKGWRALFAGQSHQHEGAARLICDRVDFWRLEGRVTMQSAAGLQRDGLAALAQASVAQDAVVLVVDWSAVQHSDSAGLALLLSWQRAALQRGVQLQCRHIPAHLQDIAQVCGLHLPDID